MQDEFQKYELIEQYLNGLLKGKALSDFSARFNTDSEFQKEVALHKDIEIGLMDKEDIPFIKTLNEIHKKEFNTPLTKVESDKSNTLIKYLKVAGAVAALLIAGLFITQFISESPTPLAVSEKIIGEPLELKTTRNQSKQNEDLILAFNEIEDNNYEEAIRSLSDLYESEIETQQSGLALGYAYMQNNQYKKAVEIFDQLLKSNPKNADEVNWYLAHSYLRDKQFNQSIAVLENMLTNPSVTLKKKEAIKALMKAIRKQFL